MCTHNLLFCLQKNKDKNVTYNKMSRDKFKLGEMLLITLFYITGVESSDKCYVASRSQELIDENMFLNFELKSDLLKQIDALLGLVKSVTFRPLSNTFFWCGTNALCASLFNLSDLQKYQNMLFNSQYVIPVDILVIDDLIYVTSTVENRKYVPMTLL